MFNFLNVLQKYGFLAIRYAFFGKMPKPITSPSPKPIMAQPIESIPFEGLQFQPNESKDGALTWKKTVIQNPNELVNLDNKERLTLLTKNDNNELIKRGLDTEKAVLIKPFWAKETSRFNASQLINTKGYSESVISKYYAAFNAIHYSQPSQSIENQ
jgi:hypothetical protein